MLWTALCDPDPVVVFEHAGLYGTTGELSDDAGPTDIDCAAVRRPGRDLTIVSYGGTLAKALDAADLLAAEGTEAEVIDLRTLRPLDGRRCSPRSPAPIERSWSTRAGAPRDSRRRYRRGSPRRPSTTSTLLLPASARPRFRSRPPSTWRWRRSHR